MNTLALSFSLIAVAGPPAARPALRVLDPDTLTTIRQVAGVRIIQQIRRGNDLVAVRLYLLGGTRQLTERTTGIEALLLHAAAYGTEHYPHGLSQRAMARTGAEEVLDPDVDWTVTGFSVLRQDLDSAWLVFADRLTSPTLDSDAVHQAREQMLTTARRRYSDPDERIRVIANQVAFPGHPYALDPAGTDASLGAITDGDLAEYRRTQMVTSRMLLVIVGNADTAQVSGLVTRTIGTLPRGEYQWTLPPAPHQNQSHYLIEQRELPTNYILGYLMGPPVSSPDYAPFRVATGLLSSRLYWTIRVQSGLSYAAYAPFLERAVGVGGLYASTPKPEKVVPIMYDQIRWLLQKRLLDAYYLSRFVTSYRLEYLSRSSTDADQADLLARGELYVSNFRHSDQFMEQLYRVSPADIRVIADRYMRAIQWAYIGNTTRMEGHW
jgi:zinc protease